MEQIIIALYGFVTLIFKKAFMWSNFLQNFMLMFLELIIVFVYVLDVQVK